MDLVLTFSTIVNSHGSKEGFVFQPDFLLHHLQSNLIAADSGSKVDRFKGGGVEFLTSLMNDLTN